MPFSLRTQIVGLVILTVCMTILCLGFAQLGMDYINPDLGHGLHPALAFPLSCLCLVVVGLFTAFICFDIEEVDAHPDQQQLRSAR